MLVAGGDAAVLMRRSAAGEALIRFLASPQAAAIWAARGGFVSPNINLSPSAYPDGISRSIARSLLEAGGNFRFSLSDLTPAGFGGTEGHGMRGILQQFLARRDVSSTAARLERGGKAGVPMMNGLPRSAGPGQDAVPFQPGPRLRQHAVAGDFDAPVEEQQPGGGELRRDRVDGRASAAYRNARGPAP